VVLLLAGRQMVHAQTVSPQPRILGYLLPKEGWTKAIQQTNLDLLTDLNLAFFNPDTDGRFSADSELAQVIRLAHTKGLRVYLSIGGGEAPESLKARVAGAGQNGLIDSLVAFAVANAFDGIDVDLENDLINKHYAPFVATLAASCKRARLLMTAALASWNADQIADSTLRLYDYINIMSYDKTGPWKPENAGPHSPFQMVVNDFKYFTEQRGIPASRLLIGLPFYGYGFGGRGQSSYGYKELLDLYPGAENRDMVPLHGGQQVYYNGLPTIRQKVAFALDQGAGGLMIWELQQDTRDQHSLLRAIYNLSHPDTRPSGF
jgi:chitinase